MDVVRIKDQKQWDFEIEKMELDIKFSQSWQWGDILLSEGKKVHNLVVLDNNMTSALAQVVIIKLPLNMSYAFCPKGPIFKDNKKSKKIVASITEYLKKKECVFFRIEPQSVLDIKCNKTIGINPRSTSILDVSKKEEDILKNMKSKTRYNIRLAQKKEMKVISEKDVDSFYSLSQKTAKRDGFSLHPRTHYEKILKSDISYQLTVECKKKIIASNVFIGYGNTFTYLYGSSDYGARQLMAPYLLQWEGIKLAKKLGYKYYDFFGIAPKKKSESDKYEYEKDHQYAGVTRFKLNFGGVVEEWSGTFDVLIDKKRYYLYQLLRKIRRIF